MKIDSLIKYPLLSLYSLIHASTSDSNIDIIPTSDLNLILEKVVIIHRHGERTSFASPFDYSHLFPLNWGLCTADSNIVHGSNGDSILSFSIQTVLDHKMHNNNMEISDHVDTCYSGQLTDKGKQTMHKLGTTLALQYSKLINFDNFKGETFFRSTGYQRTIESLQYLLKGWFPNQENYKIHVYDHSHENLDDPMSCPRYVKLREEVEAMHIKAHVPSVKTIREMYPEIAGKNPFGKEIPLYAIYDFINCRRAHNLSLPPNFTLDDLEIFRNYYISDDFKKFQDSRIRRLFSGRFFKELINVIFNDSLSRKLYIYSAHDITLIPILLTMGCDLIFPGFGSNIIFEVYRNDTDAERKVLFKYNNEIIRPTGCNDIYCTKKEFISLLEPFIPEDYISECREQETISNPETVSNP